MTNLEFASRATIVSVRRGQKLRLPRPPKVRAKSVLWGVPLPAALFGFWYLASSLNWFGSKILPTPAAVFSAYGTWITGTYTSLDSFQGTWVSSMEASMERVVLGFLIASFAGIIVGLAVGRSRVMERVMDPTIQALRPIPVTAWVPFSLIFFGISPISAIGLVVIAAFFPVMVNTATGCKHVPRSLIRAARTLGASEFKILRTVVLPFASPTIMAGLRLGLGMSWVALIVAEMVGVKSGLGYVLWQAYYWNRTDMLIATVLTIGFLGLVSDRLLLSYSKRKYFWHASGN